MDLTDAIRQRKSIRSFRPDTVARQIVEEMLDIARRATSRENSQPWEVAVVTGDVLDRIRRENVEALVSGTMPNPDVLMSHLQGIYRQRQIEVAVQIFQLMGIAREDKQKRAEWMQRGYRYFDAPVAMILYGDRSLDDVHTQFDISGFAQTICLAALHFGLGTCVEIQGVSYPQVLRKHLGIPESKRITISIALGYPDWEFPANRLESKREPVESFTTWHGFA